MRVQKIEPVYDDIQPIKKITPLVLEQEVNRTDSIDSSEDISAKLNSVLIDWTKELPPPEEAWGLTINNEHIQFGTKDNFSVIIGKPKSRKSFLISIIVNQFLAINKNEKILYFDTEQGIYHATKQIKRIVKNVGANNLQAYCMREFSPKERLEMISHCIENNNNIGLIIIDGIRDLITSINDESEATDINTRLLNWTTKKNCHIITIIHQNKADNHARGHVGTELMNKAELVLSVSKDPDEENKSNVKKEFDRSGQNIPDFTIEINENDDAFISGVITRKRAVQKNEKLKINHIQENTWKEILQSCFDLDTELSRKDLEAQIKVLFETKFDVSIGIVRTKEFVVDIINKGFIYKDGKSHSKNSKYKINSEWINTPK